MAKQKFYWTGNEDPTRGSILAISELSNAPSGYSEIPIEKVREISQRIPNYRIMNAETGYALDKSLLVQSTIESNMVIGPNGLMMPKETAANYISPAEGLKVAGGGRYLGTGNIPPAPAGTAGAAPTPTSYTVQAGDTLGAIAGKLGVPVSQLTGYRSGNPNLIYPGETILVKGADTTSKPVTLLTSSAGQDTATDNKTKLEAIQNVVNSFSGSANTPEQKAALKTFEAQMNAEINAAFAQDGLTSDERAQKREWQDIQDALKISLAKANAANASKDYSSADYHTKEAEAIMKQATDYYAATKDLRARYKENLTPSEKAQQLQTQINDIKTQIETEAIKNEEKAYAEYAGQNMSVAQARVGDIELQAKFAERKLLARENTLLRELGLEQEAQKMEQASIEKQLSWLADDYAVAQKVEDRITASEEKVYERAQLLEKDAKDTLITILDGMSGIDPSTLSPETKKQLEDMSARAGIDFNLVTTALETQHNRQVFDDALKLSQEARLGSEKSSADKTLDVLDVARYNELYPDAGVTAGDTEAQANAKVAQSNTPEAKTRALVVAAQNAGNTYNTVVSEINNDATIKDKTTALSIAKEVYGITDTVTSPIETEIARLKAGGNLTDPDIRAALRNRYSPDEINNSSIGLFMDKIGSFLFGK